MLEFIERTWLFWWTFALAVILRFAKRVTSGNQGGGPVCEQLPQPRIPDSRMGWLRLGFNLTDASIKNKYWGDPAETLEGRTQTADDPSRLCE